MRPRLRFASARQAAAALTVVTAGVIVSGADAPLPQFSDIARQAGVAFHHTNGASAEKHLVETMGSGAVFFDYDGDGWVDMCRQRVDRGSGC